MVVVVGCGEAAPSGAPRALLALTATGPLSVFDIDLNSQGQVLLSGSFRGELRLSDGTRLALSDADSADGFALIARGSRIESTLVLGGAGYDELRAGGFVGPDLVLAGAHTGSIDLDPGPNEQFATRSGPRLEAFLWRGSTFGELERAHVLKAVVDSDQSYFTSLSVTGERVTATAEVIGNVRLSTMATPLLSSTSGQAALTMVLSSDGSTTTERLIDAAGDDTAFVDGNWSAGQSQGNLYVRHRTQPCSSTWRSDDGGLVHVRGVRTVDDGALVYGDVVGTEARALALRVDGACQRRWVWQLDEPGPASVSSASCSSHGTCYLSGSGELGLLRRLSADGSTSELLQFQPKVDSSVLAVSRREGVLATSTGTQAGSTLSVTSFAVVE